MFSCQNISITRNGNLLFSKLGFSLIEGSLLYIIGKNGSGKTSLLEVLTGLSTSLTGKIEFNEIDIYKDYTNYTKQIAYLGHQHALDDELTLLDNLKFWANMRDCPELIMPAISYFGLYNMIDMQVNKLSAGWKKRASLARLMCMDAKIWILDEPEVNLDQQTQFLLENLITIKASQKGIVIIATHNVKDKQGQILNIEDFTN
jgi:heme exporter protein A